MTLVILAAGMGSRFGGLKQIEPVGPNGEFIIDYSIYDAIKAGFTKVVFIIKEENYDIFRNTIGNRIAGKIEVEYVFQKNEDPRVPSERIKPLGTGHAILCAKDKVDEDFIIINADDFYGREAFETIADFIRSKGDDQHKYGLVGYEMANTMTYNGSVKRGVLNVDEDDYLVKITESSLSYDNDKILIKPLSGADEFYANGELVSMNMISFTPYLFQELEKGFDEFLNNASDLMTAEYLIPDVLYKQVSNHDVTCKVLHTDAVWKGITYSSDLAELKEYIASQIDNGVYPSNLYR